MYQTSRSADENEPKKSNYKIKYENKINFKTYKNNY